MDFIKAFTMPIIIFLAMGYATLSHACGEDAVYPETITIDLDIRP